MRFANYINERKIPDYIIKQLAKERSSWKTIKRDLSLPIIPKGKYIGTGKPQDCFDNAKKYSKTNPNIDIYDGYLIWYDGEWNVVSHFFNVVDGKVYEITKLEDGWDDNTYYIGKKYKK